MTFSLEGLLTPAAGEKWRATGHLSVPESHIRSLYEYLQNGEPHGPDGDNAVPMLLVAEKKVWRDGFVYMSVNALPHPGYKKKKVQLSAEALADAFNGEIISSTLPLFTDK